MCILPEMICHWCLAENFGQLLRFPVEEVEDGLTLCSVHKRAYLEVPRMLYLQPAHTGNGATLAAPSEPAPSLLRAELLIRQ